MKRKTAADTTRAFKRKTTKTIPENVWSDKGTEFKGEFRQFCGSKSVELYNTHSETKSAFAEQNIRSPKNMIYRHLEKKWSYHYMIRLHDFVDVINSRVNRMTGLAPEKVTSKHESHLVSLAFNQSKKHLQRPNFKPGDLVRVSKESLPFKKCNKQKFTDEIFEIVKIATLNPPTCNLRDANREKLLGKFYKAELVSVGKNGRV